MADKSSTVPGEQAATPAKAARLPRVKRVAGPAAAAPPAAEAAKPARLPRVKPVVGPVASAPPAAEAATGAPARRARGLRRESRAPRPAPARTSLWGAGLSGVGALLVLFGLLALRKVETIADPLDPVRLGLDGLLVLGPAALFWALGQGLHMGRFWLFGTAAWAVFGYLLIFVPPPASGTPGAALAIAVFLAALFAALVAGLTVPLYALGWLLFTQRTRRLDLRRAVRQASLLALYSVVCLGMILFSVFNGLNALLLFVVLALMEFFFLSRD